MFHNKFSHYVSYGATDQETARELRNEYDGILVPGTVAAFQSEGTRGFVLTLSASTRLEYVIDPRFPLFQQRLPSAKKSHQALADALGDSTLVNDLNDPEPESFTPERVQSIAVAWLRFNGGYTKLKHEHFEKYAKRLGEDISRRPVRLPDYVLPPYTVASGTDDPWWEVAELLWDASRSAATSEHLVRVVAAQEPLALGDLGLDCEEQELVIWASGLDELNMSTAGRLDLIAYGESIRRLSRSGRSSFALYGGFFSVLMRSMGLTGSSHGVGYGESRAWLELPQSGPPPPRYYFGEAHRYISQDLAAVLWREAREVVECHCVECEGRNPALLSYQSLMKHSVHCRQREIDSWADIPIVDKASLLEQSRARLAEAIGDLNLPRALQRQADNSYAHLSMWRDVLQHLAGG
jgi:hypothetical protein